MEAATTEREQALSDDTMRAKIAKLIAETAKLNTESRWRPLVVGSGATLAIIAIVRIFL